MLAFLAKGALTEAERLSYKASLRLHDWLGAAKWGPAMPVSRVCVPSGQTLLRLRYINEAEVT